MRHLYMLGLLLCWACSSNPQQTNQAPNQAENNTSPAINFQAAGDSIVNAAQKAFVGALMKAIQERGTSGAVAFCNTHALPIADSLSRHYGCTIQRLSDRYRNPADRPQATDSIVIAAYQAQKAAGTPLETRLIEQDQQVVYYKPIILGMPTCLQCHGNPQTDIDASTLAVIRSKYPYDLAVGYKQGDLRGVWKIAFRK
ncbi:MAG: DUF3365 domain-containing protein [Cytophagales bacterium]|nr:DUF3365 domain-containing protein [Bernardetiaceae bacterium]MDW8204522.1 DUF3365 domain-containing protein [Cytophagales bacterium]